MKFCRICGSIVTNDDEFCIICGAKIDEIDKEVVKEKPQRTESIAENDDQQHISADETLPLEKMPITSGNPNLHEEYVDISSYAPVSSEKDLKHKAEPKLVENSQTKMINTLSDIESKTREVGSVKKEKDDFQKSRNDYNDISTKKSKKHSKGIKIAITICCVVAVFIAGVAVAVAIINGSKPSAEELYASGQQRYQSEDYYGAIKDLSECVSLNTSDVDAYMLLADAYIATNQENEAVSALEIGYRETGSTTIKARLDTLSEKLRVDKIYKSLVDEGNSAIKNKDYSLAITKFTSAIETKPNISEPYLLMANTYAAMKEYDKSLQYLQAGIEKVGDDEQLSSKMNEINAIIAKEKEEEEKRLAEERRRKEEEERKAQEERERLLKQPVKFETKIDDKTVSYKKTDIFNSHARWVVFDNDRDLPGIDYANNLVQKTLNSYYELDTTLFGVESEKELYELVKDSRGIAANASCRVTVTYNKNGILSFVIYKYYLPPTIIGFREFVETYTIDIKTGEEYSLDNILVDSDNVNQIIKSQAKLFNIDVNDQRISTARYFLSGDSLVFYLKNNDWEYVEIPIRYSNKDKFLMEIEEDTETKYVSLQ